MPALDCRLGIDVGGPTPARWSSTRENRLLAKVRVPTLLSRLASPT
jgi:hypothetical protein